MDATAYHDATKHHFGRFARSLGYLDWATQPNPFRRFTGAVETMLPREAMPESGGHPDAQVGAFLRCALGLSAWKAYQATQWALRVNPSSGNLHPTEAYLVRDGVVSHYAPEAHALERRAVLDAAAWRRYTAGRRGFLVGLTSVHWRESWKYGERAFRYCQHDIGHALGALRYSGALLGWHVRLLTCWSDAQMAALLGIDRAADWGDAEAEAVACLVAVTPTADGSWNDSDPEPLVAAARGAAWEGRPVRLSPSRVDWPFIDEVAAATAFPGAGAARTAHGDGLTPAVTAAPPFWPVRVPDEAHGPVGRQVILKRRSAVVFDPRSALARAAFDRILDRLQPSGLPWDVLPWPAQVGLVLFVHRVDGLTPGVYALPRDAGMREAWRAAMRPEFLWERVDAGRPLDLLVPTDVTWVASRLSCDQSIASDGFLSLGMVARFDGALREHGEWFYRRLFWECGLVGQALYLEAEAAGVRGTGIGCFYDDAVHETLGLTGHAWQSLYHFSMGVPVDDGRLTTRPGYDWE